MIIDFYGSYLSYLKVGTPLSALIPAPERTTMFLALASISLKARMSLDGPLRSSAMTVLIRHHIWQFAKCDDVP